MGDKNVNMLKTENRYLKENIQILTNQYKNMVEELTQEHIDPLSYELFVDPVTAEDGNQYERESIEKVIKIQGSRLKSLLTNKPMGPKLVSAPRIRNTLEILVKSGMVDMELVESYEERKSAIDNTATENLKDVLTSTVKEAKEGCPKHMCQLGFYHLHGLKGCVKSDSLAFE